MQEKAAAEERKRKEATPGAAGSEGQEEGQPAARRLPPQSQESKDHFKALLKNHKVPRRCFVRGFGLLLLVRTRGCRPPRAHVLVVFF